MAVDASLSDFLDAVTPHVADVTPELERLRGQIEDLRRALAYFATIDQAKGIVMVVERCTPDEAFQALSRMSEKSKCSLKDLAAALVHTASARTS